MESELITTWAPSTWCHIDPPSGTGPWGTQVLTLGCPVDFSAVRLGFINVLPSRFVIDRAVAAPSDGWNDMVNPIGGYEWNEFTQTLCGLDGGRFKVQSEIEVRAADKIANPHGRWTWTDWLKIKSAAPDPETKMRVLMVRYRLSRQRVTYVVGQFHEWSRSDPFTHGFRYFVGGYNNGLDAVSSPVTLNCQTARLNSIFNGSLIAAVQYKTSSRTVVGCVAGDSHFEGTATTSQFYNAVAQLTMRLGQEGIGRVAFGFVNAARGGATSAEFLPRAATAIEEIQPKYVVIPTWSFNDVQSGGDPLEVSRRYFEKLRLFLEFVRTRGVLPILISPIPRDSHSMTSDRVDGWLLAYKLAQDLAASGVPFIDLSKLFSACVRGTPLAIWPSGSCFTSDGVHPNDLGHGLISHFIERIIRKRLI